MFMKNEYNDLIRSNLNKTWFYWAVLTFAAAKKEYFGLFNYLMVDVFIVINLKIT